MTTEELKERVANKALGKLYGLSIKEKELNALLDDGHFKLDSEQIQGLIDYNLREQEVWKFILNSAQ